MIFVCYGTCQLPSVVSRLRSKLWNVPNLSFYSGETENIPSDCLLIGQNIADKLQSILSIPREETGSWAISTHCATSCCREGWERASKNLWNFLPYWIWLLLDWPFTWLLLTFDSNILVCHFFLNWILFGITCALLFIININNREVLALPIIYV